MPATATAAPVATAAAGPSGTFLARAQVAQLVGEFGVEAVFEADLDDVTRRRGGVVSAAASASTRSKTCSNSVRRSRCAS
ncbi:MAG: hypothetical protein AAFY28_21270, partial [Actinomycetota bacterium]